MLNMTRVIDLYVQKFGFDFYCDIAKTIVKERKNRGMSQRQLAEASKISISIIERIENVQRRIEHGELELLAKALNCPVDYLIGAKPLYENKNCLFVAYSEEYAENCKKRGEDVLKEGNYGLFLYVKAQSFEQAVFEWEKIFPFHRTPYWSGRDRAIIELVGIPVSDSRLIEASKPNTESNRELIKQEEKE